MFDNREKAKGPAMTFSIDAFCRHRTYECSGAYERSLNTYTSCSYERFFDNVGQLVYAAGSRLI